MQQTGFESPAIHQIVLPMKLMRSERSAEDGENAVQLCASAPNVAVAKRFKATGCEPVTHGFKSHRPPQFIAARSGELVSL